MDYNNIELKMQKAIDYLQDELATIRAGRANPAILNKIQVEYYSSLTPINQVASISVPEARQILVTPWDRSLLGLIEKAIQKADIGINPINDGNCIRIVFPELNEQRRKEIVKEVKSLGEEAKIAVRNVRRDSIDEAKDMEKSSTITEDELKQKEDKIQKITDKYIENIEKIVENKENEIMKI